MRYKLLGKSVARVRALFVNDDFRRFRKGYESSLVNGGMRDSIDA